jgi:tetratricopeptide (TPR) repeat protein
MADTPTELRTEIEKLERKHGEHPDGRYFAPLADAYREAGELDIAERVVRDGLQRHPDYLSARIVLGRILMERGLLQDASQEFRRALGLDPQNLVALRCLGEITDRAGDRGEAERWYRELLTADPMNSDAREALERLAAEGQPSGDDGEEEAAAVAGLVTGADALDPEEPAEGPAEGRGWSSALPDLGEDADAAATDAEEEVVTETIAELYLRQGFHERAAEVYRALIQRRGGEPHLVRRLREAEAASSGAAPAAVASLQVADPFAASFARGFEGVPAVREPGSEEEGGSRPDGLPSEPVGEAVAVEELTSGAWGVEGEPEKPVWDEFTPGAAGAALPPDPGSVAAEDAPTSSGLSRGGDSIGGYFARLLAWRPAAPAAADEQAPAAGATEEGATDEPSQEADPWEVPLPWEEDLAAGAEPGGAAGPEAAMGAAEASDFSFERFFEEKVAPEQTPTPEAPGGRTDPEREASAAGAGEEDEDLESFQAWLRSLRR